MKTMVKPKKPRKTIKCPKCGRPADYTSFTMNGSSMGYFCRNNMGAQGCGHHFRVKPTPAERSYLKAETKEMNRHSTEIHRVWHAFCRRFGGGPDQKWKLKGYAFMQAVERWAKKYPEVQVVSVDDNHHAGSYLVLVPHYDEIQKEYWGTTLVYIPQCSGEDAIDFFMYPGHLDGFWDAMEKLKRFSRALGLTKGVP